MTEPKGDVDSKTMKWEKIQSDEQVTILGSVNFQKPTPSSNLLFTGKFEYSIEGSDSRNTLDFEIPFNFVEFIRGTPMSTTDYFALWKNSKVEQTIRITSTLRNTSLFAEKVTKIFHLSMVDLNVSCKECEGCFDV